MLWKGPTRRSGNHIPEDCGREPRDFPAEDALDVWGPPLPDDFGENREIEA
jgi:hypothetical protein